MTATNPIGYNRPLYAIYQLLATSYLNYLTTMQKKSLKITLLFVLALGLSACGLLPEAGDETKAWSDAKLYAEAHDELSTGNYDKSIQYFEKLEARYPFGLYAQQAQVEMAYAYYRQGDQAQASAAVERFIKLHPNHPRMDYMLYLRGLIYFNDRVSALNFIYAQDPTERDQKATRTAFDAFKQLIERFPNSIYTPDATARMQYLLYAMTQYELHVARFYHRHGAYLAAVNRAQALINDYRDSPATEEALFIMMQSYDKLGLKDLRDDTARVFKKNFPNSKFIKNDTNNKNNNNNKNADKNTNPWWKIW